MKTIDLKTFKSQSVKHKAWPKTARVNSLAPRLFWGAPEDFPTFLWFLFYLDDLTEVNGATWVVPRSHRDECLKSQQLDPPWTEPDLERFPSRVVLSGRAGDLTVLDARTIHTSGPNVTLHPRRIINAGLIHEKFQNPIRTDHWITAGPAIQNTASTKLRFLLGGDGFQRDRTGPPPVLPPGWTTGS